MSPYWQFQLKGTGSPDIECVLEVYNIKSVLSKRAMRSHDYYFRLFIDILLFKVYSTTVKTGTISHVLP